MPCGPALLYAAGSGSADILPVAGHSVPVRGDWPELMKDFIVEACHQPTSQ
jgi:hypothetical protein